jgi:hypothetical protein
MNDLPSDCTKVTLEVTIILVAQPRDWRGSIIALSVLNAQRKRIWRDYCPKLFLLSSARGPKVLSGILSA